MTKTLLKHFEAPDRHRVDDENRTTEAPVLRFFALKGGLKNGGPKQREVPPAPAHVEAVSDDIKLGQHGQDLNTTL